MNIPTNLKYTNDHEWLKIEGNMGIIGITDYAQSQLGDIVFIDLPNDLNEITSNETFGTIEAVKTVSDMKAPCSGKVIEINQKILDEPQVVNSDPYGEGWFIKVELKNPQEIDALLTPEAYSGMIQE
ncbi:MAG: glycine cleavage system protein GcvH [Ignavibacteriales bacterium]|nr:glycine cleavage system protein GcvH [Ignavibacteriales bacterium]